VQTLFKFYEENGEKIMKLHEACEAVLFACRIYEKMGKHKEALDFMLKHDKIVVDMVRKSEMLGLLNEKLGNKDKALEHFEFLLQLNSANLQTYVHIFRVRGVDLTRHLTAEEQARLKEQLLDYEKKLPRVNSHIRIGLRHL